MTSTFDLRERRIAVSAARDRRRLHRSARRHERLTLADRFAYWQAVRGARTRPGRPRWGLLVLIAVVVLTGLLASALVI